MGVTFILIAGNRQDDAFPSSTLGGGRIQSVCPSVMDTVGRVHVRNDAPSTPSEAQTTRKRGRADDMYADFVSGSSSKRANRLELWDAIESAEVRDTVPMREITDKLVQQNVRFFFLRHAWRKAIPFLHRTMTLGVVHDEYTLFSSCAHIARSVRGLTEGLRRSYLVDHTSFKRNIQGPWQTVSAFATFGMPASRRSSRPRAASPPACRG